ncbi:hypothetical protein ACWX0K_07250 [Nitrobacteraceae bacterium UC4446_H13]
MRGVQGGAEHEQLREVVAGAIACRNDGSIDLTDIGGHLDSTDIAITGDTIVTGGVDCLTCTEH